MSTPTSTTQTFVLAPSEPIHVSKVALAVIIVFSVLSLAALIIALWVLFRFTCSRRGRRAGYAIRDGRNEHRQWWKNANPPAVSSASAEMSYVGIIPAPESIPEDRKRENRYFGDGAA